MAESKFSKYVDIGSGGFGTVMGLWGTGRSIHHAIRNGGDTSNILGASAGLLGAGASGIMAASKKMGEKGKAIAGLTGSGLGILAGGTSAAKGILDLTSDKSPKKMTAAERKEAIAYQSAAAVNGLAQALRHGKNIFTKDANGNKKGWGERLGSGAGLLGSLFGAVASGSGLAANLSNNKQGILKKVGAYAGIASGVLNMLSSAFGMFYTIKKMRQARNGEPAAPNPEAVEAEQGQAAPNPEAVEAEQGPAGQNPVAAEENQEQAALNQEAVEAEQGQEEQNPVAAGENQEQAVPNQEAVEAEQGQEEQNPVAAGENQEPEVPNPVQDEEVQA